MAGNPTKQRNDTPKNISSRPKLRHTSYMATFRLRSNTYRAEVVRKGIRRSASFASMDAAQAWARTAETEILGHDGTPPIQAHLAATCDPEIADCILEKEAILSLTRWGRVCGVYFLVQDGEIVYVGQSIDVHYRVSCHRREGKQFDAYTIIACTPPRLADLERYYIKTFAPALNISGL
jgi:hypothetical protein